MKKVKVYYQPQFHIDGSILGHPKSRIHSFEVWKRKKNLKNDFPNCVPLRFEGDDIEEPTYRD